MDASWLLLIAIVTVGAVALYVVDRYTKQQEIVWGDAAKVGVAGSVLSGGILFATTTDAGTAVVDAVKTTAVSAQEMFVGKPSF